VTVTAGIFTVQLDFGAGVFSGPPRFLEIGVRPAGSPDPYTLLSPRQSVTSTPYAVRSLNASVADVLSSACVGCVTSTQVGSVSGSAVTGTIPLASVPAGSGNYVQNTTSQQAASNFNITGNGTAGGTLSGNIVRATTQFNIGINHALSLGSSSGVFAGRLAGASNTTGSNNSFFGESAGRFNTTSGNNSFFGSTAGTVNTASDNSFFGAFAGNSNTTGTRNSFFGVSSGDVNAVGDDNSFFGYRAGRVTRVSGNSFFGSGAGSSNTSGALNAFFGVNAGAANTVGVDNSFFGDRAGAANTASSNTFFGSGAGFSNTTGSFNVFVGDQAGANNVSGGGANILFPLGNTFIGYSAGVSNISGSSNTLLGSNADVNATEAISYATAIGSGAFVGTSNTIVLGRSAGQDDVRVPGSLTVVQLGSGNTNLCQNSTSKIIGTCSSSLRYKTGVQPFLGGLDIVQRLRPITFNWKDGGMHDVGFGAEEVERIEPLLTTRNDKGEIEGVKYGQVTTVLVNAVKEQQQIIEKQQRQLEALKKLVCSSHPQADVCE
jgi:hypothetical protein